MRKITQWIADLSIGWKFRIVTFGFLLPVIILSYLLISEQNIAIHFSQSEMQGSHILQPVQELFTRLVQFSATPQNTPVLYKKRTQIDSIFASIALANHGYYHSRARLQKLRNLWINNKELHLPQIIAELPELMRLIGNESKLILDPDIKSYYLMDLTVLKIPEHLLTLHRFSSLYSEYKSSAAVLPLLELLRSQNEKIKESSARVLQYINNETIVKEFAAQSNNFLIRAEHFINLNREESNIQYSAYLDLI